MSVEDRKLLHESMVGLASGSADGFFEFRASWGHRVAGTVRSMLRSMGRLDVLHDADEFDGLVTDACLVIRDRASGWDPSGALPWTWARQGIWAEVNRYVGHRCTELVDEQVADQPDFGDRSTMPDDVELIAEANAELSLVLDAIRSTGSDRDQRVFLEYRIQSRLGDPSPSNTVAESLQLTPANVRQISKRFRNRLAPVLGSPEFADVRGAAIFAV